MDYHAYWTHSLETLCALPGPSSLSPSLLLHFSLNHWSFFLFWGTKLRVLHTVCECSPTELLAHPQPLFYWFHGFTIPTSYTWDNILCILLHGFFHFITYIYSPSTSLCASVILFFLVWNNRSLQNILSLLIHLPTETYFDCFQVGAIMNAVVI